MTALPWLRRMALIAAAAGVVVGAASAAATEPASAPQPAAIESVGPGSAVRGVVAPPGRIAGVVLWPSAASVEGRALPRGTLAVAARAALAGALASAPDARPIFEWGGTFVALGGELAGGQEDRLVEILARLASPPRPAAPLVDQAARVLSEKAASDSADPLERCRLAVFGALHLEAAGPLTPEALNRVDAAAVEAAIAAVLRRPVQARVAGPAGLAARVAAALGNRAGVQDAVAPPPEQPKSPAAVAVLRAAGAGTPDDVGLLLAFRVRPNEETSLGPGLAVLVETLREGAGSLPQRLRVGIGETPASTIELAPAPGGGGVLLLGVKTSSANSAAAWRVLEGTVSSLRALPLNEDAVFRARQRLDEQATFRATDAGTALTGLLRRQPWSWPPADRWERPVTAVEVREAARRVLGPDRQVAAVAGAVPEALLATEALRQATRVDWARFRGSAGGPPGAVAGGASNDSSTEPALRLARELWAALSDGAAGERLPGFHAKYRIIESTPLGPAAMDMILDAGQDGTTAGLEAGRWRLEVKSTEEGGEVHLPGAAAPTPLPEADRLPALLYRTPVLLAADILRGALAATVVTPACGEAACTGLRVELGEGSVLVLALDPAAKLPRLLRVWYMGRDRRRAPDEEITYSAWQVVEGVKVPSDMAVRDSFGASRRLTLLDWSWKRP